MKLNASLVKTQPPRSRQIGQIGERVKEKKLREKTGQNWQLSYGGDQKREEKKGKKNYGGGGHNGKRRDQEDPLGGRKGVK